VEEEERVLEMELEVGEKAVEKMEEEEVERVSEMAMEMGGLWEREKMVEEALEQEEEERVLEMEME
jgi:hypothetical protein